MTFFRRYFLLTCAFLTLSLAAHAENFTTNIISATSLDVGDDYIVGDSGSFNYFEVNSGGAQTNLDGIIGSRSTANRNSVVITAANSLWNNEGDLYVGSTGSVSQLTIKNGAHVVNVRGFVGLDAASVSNKVVVIGTNSLWSNTQTLSAGFDGSFNQLIITNGGRVDNTFASVGMDATAIGNSVVVTGSNSFWNNTGVLRVGDSGGNSRLTVDSGGLVNNTDGQIGRMSSSASNSVLIAGTNSVWSNSGSLILGVSGGGNSFTIQNGGIVSNNVGHLGFNSSGGTNTMLVTGTNSLWANSGTLVIGDNGGGNQLAISNGAVVRAARAIVGVGSTGNRLEISGGSFVATNLAGTSYLDIRRGTLSLNSGTLNIDQMIVTNGAQSVCTFRGGTLNTKTTSVSNTLAFVVGNGTNSATLNLVGGMHSFAGGLTISSNAYLTGAGTITSGVTDNGTISPGGSAGRFTINGSLTQQSAATLAIELGGYTQGTTYDFISVSGNAVFNGRLAVSFSSGFENVVTNGASFTVLNAGAGISGAFNNIASGSRLVISNSFGDVLVTYSGTSLILGNYHDIRDSDSDGLPNWWEQLYFGSVTGADPNADTDGDGLTNQQEFKAGTDPTDSASTFRIISVLREGSNIRVTWMTGIGRTNILQCTVAATSGSFTNSFINLFGVTNTVDSVTNYLDVGGATNTPARFYRVLLLP